MSRTSWSGSSGVSSFTADSPSGTAATTVEVGRQETDESIQHLPMIVGDQHTRTASWNDAPAAVEPASAEGARLWADYVRSWTAWNHVRTAAGLAAAALLTLALCLARQPY
jgi:hypothetical protein